jgi:hypothetical protein
MTITPAAAASRTDGDQVFVPSSYQNPLHRFIIKHSIDIRKWQAMAEQVIEAIGSPKSRRDVR